MHSHVRRAMTTWQVAEVFSSAYSKTASIASAVSGFKASGLGPLDFNVFSNDDFIAASTTNKPPTGRVNKESVLAVQSSISRPVYHSSAS